MSQALFFFPQVSYFGFTELHTKLIQSQVPGIFLMFSS